VRTPLVAGNWKMNGSLAAIQTLIDGIRHEAGMLHSVEIAVCPPFVYLRDVAALLAAAPVVLGAQNLSEHDPGAFTGEVAGAMLRDCGCRYVLVGHSERRNLYGEDDALVAAKFAKALVEGLTPILCVGETLAEREADETEAVVRRQIDAVIASHGVKALAGAIVAYEPLWAIGTGRTATPDQAQAVHDYIRRLVAGHDQATADGLRILYGGSVKAANAAELFARSDIDGGLIGGASLHADEFMAICRAAAGQTG
jgi:triosephosphate isomerase